MRTRGKLIQALFAVAVVLGGAALALFTTGEGQRPARAVGDLPPAGAAEIPNVLLLYDTSGDQNSGVGNATEPNNFLGCFKGQIKRHMPFQLVLTGRFTEGGGASAVGTCTAGYKVGGEWITINPDGTENTGLLGAHETDIAFGFAGIDEKAGTANIKNDGWSYGPNRTSTHLYKWEWDDASGTGQVVATGDVPGPVNQGMRSASADEYPLVRHFQLAPPPATGNLSMVQINRLIRPVLKSTAFGAQGDGLMDVFDDAYHYWMNDFPTQPGAEAACGDKYIIYLMGGLPGPTDYTDAIAAVTRLRNAGIVTYVVTLQSPRDGPEHVAYANAIAMAGGGVCANTEEVYGTDYPHCAFVATTGVCPDPQHDANCDVSGARDLHTKLGAVINLILDQSTSRTRAAVVNAPLLSNDESEASSQWRVNATFQMSDAGGAWHGFMAATHYTIGAEGTVVECTGAGSPATACKAPLSFDQLLDARLPDDRTLYTIDADGNRVTLDSVLRTGPEASRVATLFPDRPCLKAAFFGSTPPIERWIDLLRGASLPTMPAACEIAPSDWTLVEAYTQHKLGDIYHSSPIVVGPPELYIPDPTYLTFLSENALRPTMIYAGANDGMLHAFYLRHTDGAQRGQEAWAYVPPSVIPHLTDRIAGARPTLLLDGPLIARDVQVPRPTTETDLWRTVLVASMGRAGKQYFALDVTDPVDPRPLWTFPASGSEDEALMAKAVSSPAIGRVFVRKEEGGTSSLQERPVAFISGGFEPPLHPADDTTGRVFYVIDLFDGTVLRRFPKDDTEAATIGMDAPLSGSAAAYLDLPTTFTSRVFVGDYKGRMWRIDTSSVVPDEWTMTRLFPAVNDPTYDNETYQRPVYMTPAVSLDWARRPIVYYGTGNIDSLSTEAGQMPLPNWFFGVREELGPEGETYGNLLDESPHEHFPLRLLGGTVSDPALETVTGDPVVFNGVVLFTTFMDTGLCGFGEGRLYGVDYLTGGPRLYQDQESQTTRITHAGDTSAQSFLSLGGGVPTTPLIRQLPASVGFTSTSPQPTVSGGQFQALVQVGASGRTEDTTANMMEIDLGKIPQHADIQSVSNLECL